MRSLVPWCGRFRVLTPSMTCSTKRAPGICRQLLQGFALRSELLPGQDRAPLQRFVLDISSKSSIAARSRTARRRRRSTRDGGGAEQVRSQQTGPRRCDRAAGGAHRLLRHVMGSGPSAGASRGNSSGSGICSRNRWLTSAGTLSGDSAAVAVICRFGSGSTSFYGA